MPPAPFVGRRDEVARIREALSSARNGSGSIVLLAGEPGIGKTSLAQEISRAAAWLGTPAVWGPAIEAEGTPPYWCWRQALYALNRVTSAATTQPDFAGLDSGTSPFVFFEAVVDLLHRAAQPAGLLVVLDDLHWADSGSLRLLQVAASQVPSSRLLIVATFRQPAPEDDTALAHMLPALLRERAVSRLTLSGLDQSETGSLLSQLLAQEVSPALVRRLREQTDGNPFYLVELADGLRAGGRLDRLPSSLSQIARRRLALLDEESRRLLESAAVIGREFELGLLAAVVDLPHGQVAKHVAEAVSAGVVRETGHSAYQFTHALLREALYLDLAPSDRAATHLRVADCIEKLGPDARAARIDALAHHLRSAIPLPDVDRATKATIEAAEAAESVLAFEQAADRYSEAIDLLKDGKRSNLLLRLARCQDRAGSIMPAWQTCQLAAAAARDEKDARALAQAALVMRGRFGPGNDDPTYASRMFALCEEALHELGGADPVLEARVMGQMAIASALLAKDPPAADRAVDAARRAGDPQALYLALSAKEYEISGHPDQAQQRLQLSTEAVRVAREVDDPTVAVWAHAWSLGAVWEMGIRGQADTELAALAEAVDRIKEPLARYRLEIARGTLALIDGRYEDVVAAGAKAFEIGQRTGLRGAAMLGRVLYYTAAARTGDTSCDAELRAQKGAEGWYAAYLADQGRISEMRELWTDAAKSSVVNMPRDMWPIKMFGSAKLAVALEDREWAADVYQEIRPYPYYHFVIGFLGGYEGPFAYYAGQLAALLGRNDEARVLLNQAIAAAAALGSPPYDALARFSLAVLLRKTGTAREKALAVSLLEQAAATAERLGMRPLARAVAAELKPLEAPAGRPTPLSRRELEVVALVTDGLTNRAIGDRLHISERTAENHVKNVLDKLGLDSRVQIAAWSAGRAR